MKRLATCLLFLLAAPASAHMRLPTDPREERITNYVIELDNNVKFAQERARCFALLNCFDLAQAEYQNAALTAETIGDLIKMSDHPSNYANTFDLPALLKALDQLKNTRDEAILTYGLPADTMPSFQLLTYDDAGHRLCTILYSTPDKKLTRDFILANVDTYARNLADPPCHTFAATFNLDAAKPVKIHQFELPPNLRPTGLDPGTNGMIVAQSRSLRAWATLLFQHGKQAEFLDGPAKGPAIAVVADSLSQDDNILSIANTFTYAWTLTRRDDPTPVKTTSRPAIRPDVRILTEYSVPALRWEKQITFRNDNILRIDIGGEQKPETLFDLASGKPITEKIAREIAAYYALEGNMKFPLARANISLPELKSITFDEILKQWTVLFQYTHMRFHSVMLGITLEANGALAGVISQNDR